MTGLSGQRCAVQEGEDTLCGVVVNDVAVEFVLPYEHDVRRSVDHERLEAFPRLGRAEARLLFFFR